MDNNFYIMIETGNIDGALAIVEAVYGFYFGLTVTEMVVDDAWIKVYLDNGLEAVIVEGPDGEPVMGMPGTERHLGD